MGILSKLTISTSGDFGPSKGHEQIRKWVEKNGGKWVAKATKGITHLICSVENWKAQNDAGTFLMDRGYSERDYWLVT